jgi:hypothetical protein
LGLWNDARNDFDMALSNLQPPYLSPSSSSSSFFSSSSSSSSSLSSPSSSSSSSSSSSLSSPLSPPLPTNAIHSFGIIDEALAKHVACLLQLKEFPEAANDILSTTLVLYYFILLLFLFHLKFGKGTQNPHPTCSRMGESPNIISDGKLECCRYSLLPGY